MKFKYKPSTKEELKELIKNSNIYLGDIDVSKINDFSNLFTTAYKKITADIDIDTIKPIRSDFSGLEYWNTSHVKTMNGMFINCNLTYEKIPFDTKNVEDMSYMFAGCTKFDGDISTFNTKKVCIMSDMFYNCTNFNQDVSHFNTSNVYNMYSMFDGCEKFKGYGVEKFDTSKVENMSYMFSNCNKFNANLENWNVEKVESLYSTFEHCHEFTGVGLEKWNTDSLIDLADCFSHCYSLKDIDLSKWNTYKVNDFSCAFSYCSNLTGVGLENLDVSNATSTFSMFEGCENFNANLSKWKTYNLIDLDFMFEKCTKFEGMGLENWDTNKFSFLYNTFDGCENLKFKMSDWDLPNHVPDDIDPLEKDNYLIDRGLI